MSTALATVEPTRSVVPAEWRVKPDSSSAESNSKTTRSTEASRAAFTPLRERVERSHDPGCTTMIESVRLWQDACRFGRLHVDVDLSASHCT